MAAGQINTAGNVVTLIAPADLNRAAITLVQFREIVGLQEHIAEFSE